MKIRIIGRGNVGSHLLKAFDGKADVWSVDSRTFENLGDYADITLISVKDDAIEDVAKKLYATCNGNPGGIVAHTSGTKPIELISVFGENAGVFYPLQTFSKNVELEYSRIPVFVEGNSEKTASFLENVAALFSCNVRRLSSEQRKILHIASVFACNFTNHMWTIADNLMKSNGMDFNLLFPLISETTAKLYKTDSPVKAQTGPAVREDMIVIESHEKMLQQLGEDELRNIYEYLSESIITYKNKADKA